MISSTEKWRFTVRSCKSSSRSAVFNAKRVGDGTALGVALVYGLVAEFGGAFDVTTQLGAGTTFTICILTTGLRPKRLTEQGGELTRGYGETIMIVDHERALVALADETVAYEPVGFTFSLVALQARHTEPKRFDLVLTNETMPDLAAAELAQETQQLWPEIPIILMSGYGRAQTN